MKRLLRIWVVATLILVCSEITIRIYPMRRIETQEEMLVTYQRDKVVRVGGEAFLLLGDSSLGYAVDARMVGEALGYAVLNLALTASDNTYGDYLMLKHAKRNLRKVLGVVIFHTPATWKTDRVSDTEQTLNSLLSVNNLQGLSNRLFHQSALVRSSATFRRMIVFGMRTGLDRDKMAQQLSILDDIRNQLPRIDYIGQHRTFDKAAYRAAPLGHFAPTPYVERWLDKTLEFCARAELPVWLAVGPLPVIDEEISQEFLRLMFQWLRSKAELYPQCNLLYDRVPTAPITFFGDGSNHLSPEAKSLFTRWFSNSLSHKASALGVPEERTEWWRPSGIDTCMLIPTYPPVNKR